ncbi:MAG: DUF986 family protein [Symbiopectobacterium sp.]
MRYFAYILAYDIIDEFVQSLRQGRWITLLRMSLRRTNRIVWTLIFVALIGICLLENHS